MKAVDRVLRAEGVSQPPRRLGRHRKVAGEHVRQDDGVRQGVRKTTSTCVVTGTRLGAPAMKWMCAGIA
ncbi:hypothetical protein Airi02_059030 [Actinoallomurus iriomotensis]|uniref:Uncharacterized protein n=1 Tax=Actinoallomurus iriomotensis TaxID=478107 RepID=A0A9W6S6H7_9ACTN|nr:hypothetical protein Airi02_059030 [Actinoallomurus iriomotensis]